MRIILANYFFTLDAMALHRNKVVPRYYSLMFKLEALGRKFFEQDIGPSKFV